MFPRSGFWVQEYLKLAFFCQGSTAGTDFSEEISVQRDICQDDPQRNHPSAKPPEIKSTQSKGGSVKGRFGRMYLSSGSLGPSFRSFCTLVPVFGVRRSFFIPSFRFSVQGNIGGFVKGCGPLIQDRRGNS